MTLKRHPEVLALIALTMICATASRRAETPSMNLSATPDRLQNRSTLLCERTESMIARMQTRIDEAVRRVELRRSRPRFFNY
jgi:hypothetical protein